MAGQEKPHAPTPRRVQRAREQGQRWRSTDVPIAVALIAALAGMPRYVRWVAPEMRASLQGLWLLVATPTQWEHSVAWVGMLWLRIAGPIVGGLLIVGVLVQFALQGFRLSVRWSLHNPLAAVGQWFSVMTVWRLAKGVGEVLTMLAAAGVVLWLERRRFYVIGLLPLPSVWPAWWDLTAPALWAAVGVFSLWAAADAVVQWRAWYQRLRMSWQELKEERRQDEGDPLVRRRRRTLHRRLLQQTLQAVDRAAVVLTNPTHAAVALAWQPTDLDAPRVVAKGWDDVAAAIRDRAAAAGVPIVQNPPLARALMTSPIDQPIAEEYWREVAAVLIYLMRRRQAAEARLAALSQPPRKE